MRKTFIALMLVPGLALAQATATPPARPGLQDPERLEKRARLTRILGLAEALDLDAAQALKLRDTLAKFDERRRSARKQAADARDVLLDVARGGAKIGSAAVDGAITKLLDARLQLQAIDREMLQAVTKDLSPEQKARAALFLGRFRDRIERHVGMGGHGPGRGQGMGPGMRRWRTDRQGMAAPRPGAEEGGDLEEPPPFADEEN